MKNTIQQPNLPGFPAPQTRPRVWRDLDAEAFNLEETLGASSGSFPRQSVYDSLRHQYDRGRADGLFYSLNTLDYLPLPVRWLVKWVLERKLRSKLEQVQGFESVGVPAF